MQNITFKINHLDYTSVRDRERRQTKCRRPEIRLKKLRKFQAFLFFPEIKFASA
jgi:hypothetical protein